MPPSLKKHLPLSIIAIVLLFWSLLSPTISAAIIPSSEPIVFDYDTQQAQLTTSIQAVLPTILYVDKDATGLNDGTSWTDAFNLLESSLAASAGGEHIWVATGVYTPTRELSTGVPRSAAFELLNNVQIFGGFTGIETDIAERDWAANPTVLSGDLAGDDEVDGIGTTLQVVGDNAYHVIANKNVASIASLDGFYVTGGHASGAGADGYGGGILFMSGGINITSTHIIGNFGSYGVGLTTMGITTLVNSEISNNHAVNSPGAIRLEAGTLSINNSTIAGNTGSSVGGINTNDETSLTIQNSIFAKNSGQQVKPNTSATIDVSYSLLEGEVVAGTGNITSDPLFTSNPNAGPDTTWGTTDDILGNYNLTTDSPAKNSGNDTLVTVARDLSNKPRISGATVDMGAYEREISLTIEKSQSASDVLPGEHFTYTLTLNNVSSNPIHSVLITDVVPTELTNVVVESAGIVITSTGTLTYTWQAEDLASGQSGVITISGVISVPLPASHVFSNTAEVSGISHTGSPLFSRSDVVQTTILQSPPVASDDIASTDEETAVPIYPLANDLHLNGDTLFILSHTPPVSGTSSLVGEELTFNPNGDFNYLAQGIEAVEVITYTISDGVLTDTGQIAITITGINDAPELLDDNGTTNEDTQLLVDVLANDIDPDAIDVLTIDSVGIPSNGTAIISGTDILFDPGIAFNSLAEGVNSIVTFPYTATDGLAMESALITITVTGINDAPIAVDDSGVGFTTTESSVFTTTSVLSNDSDIDGPNTITVTTYDDAGLVGSLVYNGDATFTYNPGAHFDHLNNGDVITQTFTYTITDGILMDTATVTITISGETDLWYVYLPIVLKE